MKSISSSNSIGLLWLLSVACCSLFVGGKLTAGQAIDSNMLNLLPAANQIPELEAAIDTLGQRQSQKLVLLVGSRDTQAAAQAIQELSAALDVFATPFFLQSEDDADLLKSFSAIYQFYLPYKNVLLSDEDSVALSKQQYDPIVQRAYQHLYSPVSTVNSSLLQQDPFFTFADFLNSQMGSTTFNWFEGKPFVKRGGYYYFLYIGELHRNAFDLTLQTELVQQLDTWYGSAKRASDDIQLLRTGALFYAQAGVMSAKKEISVVGLGSAIAIVLLILVVFRGLTPLLFSVFAIYCGIAFGAATTLLIFDHIHVMALVFGATLLGISIDYSFHFWAEQYFHPDKLTADAVIRLIRPALTLGLLSSCLAFVSLLFGNFPGLQQIAIISIMGLFGAYLTVIFVFPLVSKTGFSRSRILRFGFSREAHDDATRNLPMMRLLSRLVAIRLSYIQRLGLLVVLLLVSLAGASALVPNDNVKLLQPLAESLKSQQSHIEQILQQQQMQQFFLVRAKSIEALLQREEKLRQQLLLAGADSHAPKMLSGLIPSQARQKTANSLLTQFSASSEAQEYLSSVGLSAPELSLPGLLTVDAIATSPLAKQSSEFLLSKQSPYISVVFVPAGVDTKDLAKLHQPELGVFWIDRAADISHVFESYRTTAGNFLMLGGAMILIFFLCRYGIRQGVLSAGVPITCCILVLCLLALLRVDFNLFHLLGLMVVLGLGLDYSIFLTEHQERQLPTLLAVLLSVCTSLLAFGLLSLSATPAVSAFGVSVLLGVSSMFVLAVLVLSSSAAGSL